MTTRQMPFLSRHVPHLIALLRIVAAYLFIQHGTAKLFGIPKVAMFEHLQLLSLPGIAGFLELGGGTLLLVGLFSRATAFLLSGEMAVAYFTAHAPNGAVLAPMLNGGELAVLYCFVFLFLSGAGPGSWSVDSLRLRSRD